MVPLFSFALKIFLVWLSFLAWETTHYLSYMSSSYLPYQSLKGLQMCAVPLSFPSPLQGCAHSMVLASALLPHPLPCRPPTDLLICPESKSGLAQRPRPSDWSTSLGFSGHHWSH